AVQLACQKLNLFVELAGVDPQHWLAPFGGGNPNAPVERGGHDETLAVISMFTDEIEPSGRSEDAGRPIISFIKRFGNRTCRCHMRQCRSSPELLFPPALLSACVSRARGERNHDDTEAEQRHPPFEVHVDTKGTRVNLGRSEQPEKRKDGTDAAKENSDR